MNKSIIILLCLLIIVAQLNAQIGGHKLKTGITIMGNIEVKPGDTLHLGRGSDFRGDFTYVYAPQNVLLGSAATGLPKNWANRTIIVKFFREQNTKKYGQKTVAVVNPGGINYVADIEAAVTSGEIVAINSKSVINNPASTAVPSPSSAADELKKMKDLLDSGDITKEEYETAKKKILNQ